jgi:uncharacterized Ntn-hydrolase superfamily protein
MKLQNALLRRLAAPALLVTLLAAAPSATWSIVVIDTATGEICVATATCLAGFDIQTAVPVILVGRGGAAAQSFVSFASKQKIYNGFLAGDTPQQILDFLAATDGFHQGRQYGIVDFANPSVSFTGTSAGEAKEDFTGTAGTLKYSIQGNVLTGDAVTYACEAALLATPGDLGQRVMAAMEAARALGGDGRCSCSPSAPTSCGVPPPTFTKSAHNASIQLARMGDVAGPCVSSTGCSSGVYYLDRNVIGGAADPDPVLTLQALYDAWRAGLVGRPDHVRSTVETSAARLPADGLTSLEVTVHLVDLDGTPLASGGAALAIAPAGGAPALTTVGPVTDHGDGSYSFAVTAGAVAGTETLAIVADDGVAAATLYPYLTLELDPASSFHAGHDAISVSAGATVPFTLDLGAAQAGVPYVVLATATGTAPGLALPGGALLPLNPDPVTSTTLVHPGPPLLPGSAGALDAAGRASAALAAPPGLLASAVGQHLDWAALTLGAPLGASVADGFDLLP